MWLKYLITTLLFYFFAILQNSFLVHFNIFGITPNFILIFCFLLIFFEKPDKYYLGIFASLIAGLLLDIFSHSYFGVSIVSLLLMMFLVKKALQLLWDRRYNQSVFYFIPLFTAYLIVYRFFLNISLFVLNPSFADFDLSWTFIIALAYNFVFALSGFYICQKFNLFRDSDRQLKLFR